MVIVVLLNEYGGGNSHDGDKNSYGGDINTVVIVVKCPKHFAGEVSY